MATIDFAESRPYTLGVELEFQVLARESLDLVPAAPAIIADVPVFCRDRVAPEFLRSILEVQTGVCESVDEAADQLRSFIPAVEEAARRQDCLLFSASLHPFAEPADQVLSDGERYLRIMDELQYVGRQFISQGLHVHVGMADRETAIRVCDGIQVYLPVLLGLSTSSPYFRGEDTGLCSFRTKLFEALPMAGIAGYIGSWQGYEEEITMLRERGIIHEVRDLWWDVRPSPGFGTVEIRACDLPSRFSEVMALTGLVQALAAAIAEQRLRPQPVSPQLLQWNKWQAARHGLRGQFVDPLGLLGPADTVRRAAARMLEILAPWVERFGSGRWLGGISSILEHGTGAERQRALVARGADFREMIRTLQGEYWL